MALRPFLGSLRALVSASLPLLAALQIGCSSSSSVQLAAPNAELVSHAGVIELRDDHGRTMPIAPDSQLRFVLRNGATTSRVRAGALCRTAIGFGLRGEKGCADPQAFVAFNDIESVEVENWDRAGTTALIAVGVVIVVGAIVYVATATSKDKADDDRPRPPSSRHTSGNVSAGQQIAPALQVGDTMMRQAAYEDAVATPRVGIGPLFGTAERRRASVQVLLDTEISGSLFTPRDSFATGGRIGTRLWDFFDVSLGVRVLSGIERPTRPTPVLGLGFHGPLPRARWFAIGVGGELGATSAIELYASARLGVRLAPFSRFWISIYPLHPTYTSWSHGFGDRWVAASTLEMAYAF